MADERAGWGALPTGTVTFLRTDVEGSMSLARELGARWDDVNATHLGLIRRSVDAHGGAAVMTGAFEGLSERHGFRVPTPLQQIINTREPRVRLAEGLDAARLATLLEQGRRLSLDEAVAYTVEMADEIERSVSGQP
jgi:class 3 adenylate cyclase